jgi:hypothetical protein
MGKKRRGWERNEWRGMRKGREEGKGKKEHGKREGEEIQEE